MVAAAMTTAILAAGFGAFTISQKTTRITGQVGSTQATASNALDMIAADIKLAGFGMHGLQNPVGGCRINATPSAIVPGDNNPLGQDTGPDTISVVVPMTNSIATAGALWQVNVPPAGTIGGQKIPIANIPLPGGAVAAMGNSIPGGMAALNGMTVSIAGVAGSTITGSNPGGLTINPAIPDPIQFGHGTQVYLVQCITYQIIPPPDALNICQGNAPCLVRGAVPANLVPVGTPPNCNQAASNCGPIMDGVEDLQLAYACDGCDPRVNNGIPDGQVDDTSLANGFDQADFITNRNWFGFAGPYGTYMTPDKIRLVQISIVARQTRTDQGMGEANMTVVHNNNMLTISDHRHTDGLYAPGDTASAAQQQSYFQFRRRILQRTVELRNQR
jgi:type IV pilus assembly protein PilW